MRQLDIKATFGQYTYRTKILVAADADRLGIERTVVWKFERDHFLLSEIDAPVVEILSDHEIGSWAGSDWDSN